MTPHESYLAIISDGSRPLYQLMVVLSALVGGFLIRRDSLAWPMAPWRRMTILGVALLGSLVGCAIPAFLAGGLVGDTALLDHLTSPKTVLGGLLGGFLAVAAFKRITRDHSDTSDAFARGGVAMMALGRLGCIAQHCCYGRAAPHGLGYHQGDGIARIPVQAIEATALLGLAWLIFVLHARGRLRGRLLFLLFAVYGALRFALEFLREPIASEHFGIGFYQWIALLLCVVGLMQLRKRSAPATQVELQAAT